ncbi:MAG: DUF1553 domain-containing protein [Isosphaeraceae bacterium]
MSTPEDFGAGAKPAHPELLDWLAVEFLDRGWSLKEMHRLIVTSATYRQSSKVSPELLAKDPRNELLARAEVPGSRPNPCANVAAPARVGPVEPQDRRAERLPAAARRRDLTRLGGPSWPTSEGADRYRRGLYTFWKRTAPYAAFMAFDSPSSDAVCVRRERSNTPLQALTLLNDATFIEADMRGLARRSAAARLGSDEARAAYLFRLVLSAPRRGTRCARSCRSTAARPSRFRAQGLDPKSVAGEGAGDADSAAWTVVARGLLNLDEAVTKE